MTIQWKRIGSGQIEGKTERFDFVITDAKQLGLDGAVMDVFNAQERDAELAHIGSVQCDSVDDAKRRARDGNEHGLDSGGQSGFR
jgi:hypothetical protein